MDDTLSKIARCSKELSTWNQEVFSHMGTEIQKLETRLCGLSDAKSRRRVLGEIREWKHKEEIMWSQRARADFLKYGDSNTRWFHS